MWEAAAGVQVGDAEPVGAGVLDEAEAVPVEAQRGVEVADLQVDVPDERPGGHSRSRSGTVASSASTSSGWRPLRAALGVDDLEPRLGDAHGALALGGLQRQL